MPAEQTAQYKARAGALTLGYLNSTVGWEGLLEIFAQAATGAELIDFDALVVPSRDDAVFDIFADRYLLEPANPDDDPDDVETPMRATPAGREVPLIGAALSRWYERCPSGTVVSGVGSGDVLAPLLSGWVSTVVHSVAAGPRSAAEIEATVGVLPAELVAGNIEQLCVRELFRAVAPQRPGEEQRYEPTEWLRLAVAPLAAAARMELRHPREDTAPIAAADAEAILRLALPLARIPQSLSGSCSLSVELDEGVIGSPVELTVRIDEGSIVACEPGSDPEADAWIAGTTGEWLDTVIESEARPVRSGGDWRIPRDLLGGLHRALFR